MEKTERGVETKTEVLRCRVTQKKKTAFKDKAISLGRKESELMEWLVDQLLASKEEGSVVEVGDTDTRGERVGTRVNEQMKLDLRARAKRTGTRSVSSYLYLLIKAHLSQEASFTEKELDELQAGRNELSAIGRNINQIAKVLNASPNEAHHVQGIQLERVGNAIKDYRDSVGRLMRANLARWGVEVEDEEF